MIQNLHAKERPRERCLHHGPESLSLRECLAVLLGSGPKGQGCMGLAQRILEDSNQRPIDESQFFSLLDRGFDQHTEAIPGLGPAGKARLMVCGELARRYWQHKQPSHSKEQKSLKKQIREKIPESFRKSSEEQVAIMARLNQGQLSSFIVINQGDDHSVSISRRQLLQTLIYLQAQSFWIFHNHPNNILQASYEDQEMTKSLRLLAKLIDIKFNGHWIVGWEDEIECESSL